MKSSGSGQPTLVARLARRLLILPIQAYSALISPIRPRRCRYEPTCSSYAVQAIVEFGAIRGGILAAWRLLRCNPFSHGGYDPVSAQRVFATKGPQKIAEAHKC